MNRPNPDSTIRPTSGETEAAVPPGVSPGPDFIRAIVAEDLAAGKHRRIVTRFPPEPNGYLHIGHAKSICLNFGLGLENQGACHLRFDDTNPLKEDQRYVDAIMADVRWLGFDWGEHLYHASDYFEQLYKWAVHLVEQRKAYVDDASEEEIRHARGTITEPGRDSQYRGRSVRDNLDLLGRMRNGEFADGARVLRARIDMAHPNMKMRDPLLYRIRRVSHHRTGDAWYIYPMYDFAHSLSDAIEGITHSICTLEFENNRELYDWFIDNVPVPSRPRQIEFARLNLSHTVMSKRLLLQLVQQQIVHGWDDPRLPTLSGLRRRGYTPAAIRAFCERIGVARRDSVVDLALLEYYIREELNRTAPRVMAVLRPLRVVIENYPEGQVEELEAIQNPEDPSAGTRRVPFSRLVYIEQDDFREDPPKGYFRLRPGGEVRLKHAYFIRCHEVVKDAHGGVVELRCTYDPATKSGAATDGRSVKGTLHWVSAAHALAAEVRLYDTLFAAPDPAVDLEERDLASTVNPRSLEVLSDAKVEPSLADAAPGARFQFLRHGYFVVDPDTVPGKLVFGRTVTLRDTWAKIEKKHSASPA